MVTGDNINLKIKINDRAINNKAINNVQGVIQLVEKLVYNA